MSQILETKIFEKEGIYQSVGKKEVKFKEEVQKQPEDKIESIIISFNDIYEKEKRKFKELRSERSASREKNFIDRSFEGKLVILNGLV